MNKNIITTTIIAKPINIKIGGLGEDTEGGEANKGGIRSWITGHKCIVGFLTVATIVAGLVGAYFWSKKKSNKSEDDSFEQEAGSVVK